MFELLLSIAYHLVALFYLSSGVLLLMFPHIFQEHLKKLFPVLATFRYGIVANGFNLILVGLILLWVASLVTVSNVGGFLLTLTLSALEVYLGVVFYYRKERNIPQALIHFVLHILIVIAIGIFILSNFPDELRYYQNLTKEIIFKR